MAMHSVEKKRIRGIFFDFYGTLCLYGNMKKAWADWPHYFHASLKEYGLILSKEDFSKASDRFFGQNEPVLPESNQTVFEKRIKSLCSSLKIDISAEDIGLVADLIASKWQGEIKLDQEVIPVLKKLKGSKVLGLISNFDHPRHVKKVMSHHQLTDFFQSIIISGDVGVRKPDPRILELALEQTGLYASEVAYVGDTEEDVIASRSAGIVPILILRPTNATDRSGLDFQDDDEAGELDCSLRFVVDVMKVSSLKEILQLIL